MGCFLLAWSLPVWHLSGPHSLSFSRSWLWLQYFWSLIPNLLFLCQPFPDSPTLSFLSLLVPCCLACSNSGCSCLLLWRGFWSPPHFPNSDPLCTHHYPVLDNFCKQNLILHCVQCQHCHHDSGPGWNNITCLFREKAKFWYSVWKQAGSPSGILHHIKRNAKSRYNHEVRRLKHREQFIRHEKMAAASNSKSFWQQVDCINKSHKPVPVPSVDGVSGSSHHFKCHRYDSMRRLLQILAVGPPS